MTTRISAGRPYRRNVRRRLRSQLRRRCAGFHPIGAGVALADVLDGQLENAPAHCVLDEFREVAFLGALRTAIGAQVEVGVLRDLEVPADGFFFHLGTFVFARFAAFVSIHL